MVLSDAFIPHNKHFTFFTHKAAPNGWKVAMILEELGLTYESIYLDFKANEQKDPRYTRYNPDGRIPAIIDHKNNDLVLWESSAIILYLVEKYDKDHEISIEDSDIEKKCQQLQWIFYQSSSQGQSFQQSAWFYFYHSEKVKNVQEFYRKEVVRVTNVLESVLSRQEWLVGNKPTVSDLVFYVWGFVWTSAVTIETKDFNFNLERDCPHVHAWYTKIGNRKSVKKIEGVKASLQE